MKLNEANFLRNAARLLPAIFGMLGLVFLATPAAAGPAGCSANRESRQLDYWLGDWTVSRGNGPVSGTSNVTLSLDKCLVVERWTGGMGHSGENIFAYSFDDKDWHGLFADNEGRVHVFEGKVEDGAAEFHGPSQGENGETVLNRLRITRQTADKVVQTWDKSTDGGKTWTTVFQGEYARKSR